jgi:4-hydroxythreonine-4-phosphate dehydrogenase
VRPGPLALTLGDPAGIGPEITVKAWQALRESGPAFLAIGDFDTLAASCAAGVPAPRRISAPAEAPGVFPEALPVLDLPAPAPAIPGRPSAAAAPMIVKWIEAAVALALRGEASGVVTAPIAKALLYEAGFAFPGHTEFLGELTAAAVWDGVRGPVMMLTAQDLRVSLVTVHAPIAEVPALLSCEAIVRAGLVTAQALRRDFGVARPRVAVAGLNPHAGESGALGREEVEMVEPAVRALREQGVEASGPYPADTLFTTEMRRRYDAAVCLYHDQALIPVKMLDFWGGVNVTLGLPIVRTSPDHGTGFDIAGRGVARADSLVAALRLAHEIAARRAQG